MWRDHIRLGSQIAPAGAAGAGVIQITTVIVLVRIHKFDSQQPVADVIKRYSFALSSQNRYVRLHVQQREEPRC
jgi:hypothetical protein